MTLSNIDHESFYKNRSCSRFPKRSPVIDVWEEPKYLSAIFRSSRLQMFFKISQNSQEKHLWLSLIFKLNCRSEACSFIKKGTLAQVFLPVNVANLFRTPISKSIGERLFLMLARQALEQNRLWNNTFRNRLQISLFISSKFKSII